MLIELQNTMKKEDRKRYNVRKEGREKDRKPKKKIIYSRIEKDKEQVNSIMKNLEKANQCRR